MFSRSDQDESYYNVDKSDANPIDQSLWIFTKPRFGKRSFEKKKNSEKNIPILILKMI